LGDGTHWEFSNEDSTQSGEARRQATDPWRRLASPVATSAGVVRAVPDTSPDYRDPYAGSDVANL